MKKLIALLLLALPALAFGQIVKTAAVPYTKGTSPYTPNTNTSSEIRIDTATSQLYWWNRNALTWTRFQPGIDIITGGVAPAYTPRDNQSYFAINADNELWYYDGATWGQIVGAGAAVNIYTSDGLLKAGGTEVGLDSGSLKLLMATDAAATKYGIEIVASNATGANRFLSGRTESDSFRIQESGGDYFFIVSADLQLNISDQLRVLADSVQYFEGVIQTSTALPYLHGNTSAGWVKRFAASGNSGKALVSDGNNWTLQTVLTTGDGNGIYSGSGNVPDGTVATLVEDFEFSGADTSSYTVTTGTSRGGQYFQNFTGATVLHRDTSGSSALEFTGTGANFNFTDGSTDRLTITGRDARYAADYSATFSDRSLIDKGYVDGLVSIPEAEIPFGNATSDGIESSPDFTFIENDGLYIVDANLDVNGGAFTLQDNLNPYAEITDVNTSGNTGGGVLRLRSADGAAQGSGDRLGFVGFMGATDVGGTTYGATIECFTGGAWGAGDAPGSLVFNVTQDGTTTLNPYLEIAQNGRIRQHAYGDGTFAGTATYAAGWDANGNIVEFTPTAGGISLGSANQVFGMNAAGTANEYKTLNGTTNQVTVTHGTNSVTWALPQDIHTGAMPTFSDLTVTDDLFVTDDITMNGTLNQFTMSGSTANGFTMNGAAQFNVGNSTANGTFQYLGANGATVITATSSTHTIEHVKTSASGTAALDGAALQLSTDDGAALANGHALGTVQFRSRGSTAADETGGQITAYADGGDWTGASNPTKIEISVVPSGSDVLDVAATIRQSGQLELNNYGSGTFTGTAAYNLAATSGGAVIERPLGADELNLPGVLRPSQLTATQDDWNPSNFSTTKAQTIYISGDASFRFIRGLTAATRDGVLKTFVNNGTNCLGFAKQHASSTAANRFKDEVILLPEMSATFAYDSVATRWKLVSSTKENVTFSNWKEDDYRYNGGAGGATDFYQFVANGGSHNKSSANATIPTAINRLISGSAATAWPTISTHTGTMYLVSNKSYIQQFARVQIPTLSTASEDFDVRFGFEESVDTTISHGAYINYQREENSGGWTIKTNNGSSTSTTNAGGALSAATFYNIELIYYPFGEVVAFIDGTRYTTTSTLPNAIRISPMLQLDKDNGTGSLELYFTQLKVLQVYVSD